MTRTVADLVELAFWFYNLDNGRPHRVVQGEVEGILYGEEPAFLGGVEAVGQHFDPIDGYALVRDATPKPRANIVAWIREDLVLGDVPFERWRDLRTSWPRTKFGGTHEPRSILETRVGRIPVFVGHQPPTNIVPRELVDVGQREGIRVLSRAMRPGLRRYRPEVALADWNATVGHAGPGPSMLADRIGGVVVGGRIDAAVVRRAHVVDVAYPKAAGGTALDSDHGHAFRTTLAVPAHWTRPRKEK